MKNNIFLLGGHDLEMMEISRLLVEMGIVFYDRALTWENARLSAYDPELKTFGNCPGVEIWGVELQEDASGMMPQNYHRIDHHNEYEGLPSSLEQVADVLGVDLTREQRLVAANDSGYIPAMIALEASAEEVAAIRGRDRAAQGVTQAEEALAREAVQRNREQMGELTVVRALGKRFSPICDILWPYARLLIYDGEIICYYGVGKECLTGIFNHLIRAGRMYHGGGIEGFLGTARGAFTPEELTEIRTGIIRLMSRY